MNIQKGDIIAEVSQCGGSFVVTPNQACEFEGHGDYGIKKFIMNNLFLMGSNCW
jgi:hypothetical protein